MEGDGWILVILGVIGAFIALSMLKPPSARALPLGGPQTITNEKTLNWVDYKGRKRSLTVHRKVEVSG